jgi:hypothetical protein
MSSPIQELTYSQYQKILRFWRLIEETRLKIDAQGERVARYCNPVSWLYSDWDLMLANGIVSDPDLEKYQGLQEQLALWEQEYETYIKRIGFQFGDRQMTEPLFQLINQGIII